MREVSRIAIAKVATVVLMLSGSMAAVIWLGFRAPDAASVAGLVGFAILTLIDYLADREVLLALYRSLKFLAVFIILASLAFASTSLFQFAGVVDLHADAETKDLVKQYILQIKIGFIALAASLLLAAIYGGWKFKSTRFAEGRVTLLKDLLVQVSAILGDNNKGIPEKKKQALTACLTTLLAAIELSPWQWLLRRLRSLSRSSCVCAVEILEPQVKEQNYRITFSAYPAETPNSAKTVLEWIEGNYFPTFLHEARFQELVDLAKGVNPRGWESRFFNFKKRAEVVSAVGWIGKKKVILLSPDAQKCRAFDSSYLELVEKGRPGISKKDLNWTKIRSFLGCPLGGESHDPSPVLFVTKSVPHGFVAEDREVVIAVSQVIDMVLSATSQPEAVGP